MNRSRAKEMLAWAVRMFGPVALKRDERAARFIEEAIELVHTEGLPAETLLRIVSRVYSRPRGDLLKEIGQAAATLDLLAENVGVSAASCCELEFCRCESIPKEEWTRRHVTKIALGIANVSGDS